MMKRIICKMTRCLVSCMRWFKAKKYELYFRFFYKSPGSEVKIIVADFGNYPLYREKYLCGNTIKCGIGNLFDKMKKFGAGLPYDVTLVINLVKDTEEKRSEYVSLQKGYPFIKRVIFRNNTGFGFGAYNEGYKYLRGIGYGGDVLFINSSARGPSHNYWLLKYSFLFHREKHIGLCGVSLNSMASHLESAKFRPHVQSFFMYTDMKILDKVFNGSLPGSDLISDSYKDIISEGEIEFSRRIIDNGYGICSELFDHFIYYKNSAWTVPAGDMRYDPVYNEFANEI